MYEYELYTFPNCEKCSEVKRVLDDRADRGITYREVSLGSSDGKRQFGKIYPQIIDLLKRDSNGVIMPILVCKSDSRVESFSQDASEIERLLEVK